MILICVYGVGWGKKSHTLGHHGLLYAHIVGYTGDFKSLVLLYAYVMGLAWWFFGVFGCVFVSIYFFIFLSKGIDRLYQSIYSGNQAKANSQGNHQRGLRQ